MNRRSEPLTSDDVAQRILVDFSLSQAAALLREIEGRGISVWWCRSCEGLHQSPDGELLHQHLRGIKSNYSAFVALLEIERVSTLHG